MAQFFRVALALALRTFNSIGSFSRPRNVFFVGVIVVIIFIIGEAGVLCSFSLFDSLV